MSVIPADIHTAIQLDIKRRLEAHAAVTALIASMKQLRSDAIIAANTAALKQMLRRQHASSLRNT